VIWRYTTRRVLTMEFVEGRTLNEIDMTGLGLAERRLLAETITGAWFKQIFEHGFFHGDPHPANLLYVQPGQIGLLDFGIVDVLSQQDLENGTLLFLAILDQDIPAVKRRLKHLGVQWETAQEQQVERAVQETFRRYYGVSLAQLDPANFLREILDLIYTLHLELPTRFLVLDKALITLEGVVSLVYPDLNVFETAKPYARRLIERRYLPQNVTRRVNRTLSAYKDVLQDYPFQVHALLNEAKDGEFAIRFVHTGLEDFAHKLDVLTNRVVVALIAVSMGVSSAFIAVFVDAGPELFGLSMWGIPGLLAAGFFGVWLMLAIFRSGRL
jgi:ubiquinone biosynthesis protein